MHTRTTIAVYTLHLVYTQIGLNIWNPIKFNTELSFIMKKIHFEMLLKHKYGYTNMVFVNILHMRCWAVNFKNKEVRAMKCLPIKISIKF